MKLQNKQGYITIPSQAEGILPGGSQSEGKKKQPDTAAVAYRLEQLIEELGGISNNGNGNGERPKALLVAQGNEASKCLKVCEEAGLEMYIACTRDQENGSLVSPMARKVSIGEEYSEQLFSNSYAILNAAQKIEAKAVLLSSSSLAADKRFLDLAWNQGLRVYRTLDASTPKAGWVSCQLRKAEKETVAWRKCPHCGLLFDEKSFTTNHYICPACGDLLRMSSIERIDDVLDADSFTEWVWDLPTPNPLGFPGYVEKIESCRIDTGLSEAVRCGIGAIAGIRFALCIMDSTFLMGSMGQVVGEKIVRTVEQATAEKLPLIIWTASGGARMQEGLMSLMQMAKISCSISEHSKAGLPYIAVLTDPTTGGVTASFAMQADIVLAEPKTLIGFAGQRVIQDTIKRELPEGFQTAEFALQHGLIDAIVPRQDLRHTLVHLLAIHTASKEPGLLGENDMLSYSVLCERLETGYGTQNTLTYGMIPQIRRIFLSTSKRLKPVQKRLPQFSRRNSATPSKSDIRRKARNVVWQEEAGEAEGQQFYSPRSTKRTDANDVSNPAWQSVLCARNTKRPTALSYINSVVDGFIELHGDRAFADDGAIVCGLGWIGAQPVTIIAQEKGADLNERIKRNFGCPMPEGYRKSARIMKQAAKFGRPIVCFVDTQGAYCGLEAEERGQGNAIAENLSLMATLETPVISVLIGEGGSGGALALALADRVAMQKNAVYSILSPEGFASILWKDVTRAPEAAAVMRISAGEALEMGVVDTVLSEGEQAAHENPEAAANTIKDYLIRTLDELDGLSTQGLLEARFDRFRKF